MKEYIKKIKNAKNVIIYGTGIMGKALFVCIKDIANIKCFMVTDKISGLKSIDGIPVIDIHEGEKYKKTALILIAVIDKYYKEILESLKNEEYINVLPITFESELWEYIREEYIRSKFREFGRSYQKINEQLEKVVGENCLSISVYQVRSHKDKELDSSARYDWEIPIQAGAELTTKNITKIKDNINQNISYKNKEYCELTALYWIWKNDHSEWKGLCHYRRHFKLSRKMLEKVGNSDIDVILTVPILNFPNVKYIYCHDHMEQDWLIMMKAIRELQPEYYETAVQLQKGQFYYGYNMLIAKEEIFDRYCTWLFAILEYCEKYCERKKDKYQNRYIGFLAERLMSIYFLHHWEDYLIVHCSKIFLSEKYEH